jgi:hypothetical protein
MHSRKGILSKSWERVTGTCTSPTELLDTRWCHYQTLQVPVALTQKGEKPAPEDENDREKGRNVLRPTSGKHRNSGSRSNMKRSLEICRKIWKTRGCWFRGRMAPHTPPCTATIDGGSTELRTPTTPHPAHTPVSASTNSTTTTSAAAKGYFKFGRSGPRYARALCSSH